MAVPRMAPVDGARLTRIGNEIWAADRELILPAGQRLPIRMVVLRGRDRRLLCYSPVATDIETVEALQGLGEVTWLAAPNRQHRRFLHQASQAFPGARIIGCRDHASERGNGLPQEGDIDGMVDFRVVPLRRRSAELVLYHDASETLVVCDLIQNLPAPERALERWLMLGAGGARRAQKLLDRSARAGFYRWAMARPFSQISMAHGTIIRDGAREVVYRLFRA